MSLTTDYRVSGMTCGHCVRAVTDELTTLDGVDAVTVDLVTGGVSTVHVTSDATLHYSAVRDAVDEAGYQLVTA